MKERTYYQILHLLDSFFKVTYFGLQRVENFPWLMQFVMTLFHLYGMFCFQQHSKQNTIIFCNSQRYWQIKAFSYTGNASFYCHKDTAPLTRKK